MGKLRPSIIIVEDDPLALDALRAILRERYDVHGFTAAGAAEAWITAHRPALAILDLNLQGDDGLRVLRSWKGRFPELDILFCSGESSVKRAIATLREGASDYLVKPPDPQDLLFVVERILEKRALCEKVERLDPLLRPHPIALIGESPAIRELRHKAALLRKRHELNVLILGESGTGKEVMARFLHQQEEDATRPFVVANMPAIPAPLMEAELFGVEKGAYTDAKCARAGRFEMADGGDLFLDEIGDLALETQAKLLRALQERQTERLGGGRARPVRARVISATNRPLAQLIAEGRFREDLMYRLADLVLWMPPLREHAEDIPALAAHFVEKHAIGKAPALSARAEATLMAYSWPGNVRQLESAIKRALVFNRGPLIDEIEIYDPAMLTPVASPEPRRHEDLMQSHERGLIEAALRRHRGNRAAVMAELGVSRATFYRKLQALRIPLGN